MCAQCRPVERAHVEPDEQLQFHSKVCTVEHFVISVVMVSVAMVSVAVVSSVVLHCVVI